DLRLSIDALDPVQELVLPARAGEHLERAVVEPLGAGGRRPAGGPGDELEQGPLAEGHRGDRARFEVPVLADPGDVDPAPVLAAVAVEVDEAGVEPPPSGHVGGRELAAHPGLDP